METVAELEETVEAGRAQAAADAAHLPDLAAVLTALAVAYHGAARYPDAVALIEEAAETWRRTDGHRAELADALSLLSDYYRTIGLDEEADEAAEEARLTRQGLG